MHHDPLMVPVRLAVIAVLLLSATGATGQDAASPTRVYVGTYTRGDSKGIYVCDFDPRNGKLSEPRLAAPMVAAVMENPSFLAVHPSGDLIIAVNEVSRFGAEPTGYVTVFGISPDEGWLKTMWQQSSGGAGPCYVTIDAAGKHVLVANYGGGSVASLSIFDEFKLGPPTSVIQHEGSSVHPQRQKGPHAHSISFDPSGRFAVAADLGLDKLLVYRFDALTGALTPHGETKTAPGAGPRHFAFHPQGRHGYVINEMTSTVTAYNWNATHGTLNELQTITTLPSEHQGNNSTAEIAVHPSGRFLYGSNRGHDSIAIFRIDEESGKLTALGHQPTGGKTPRNFTLSPDGRWLLAANQNSHNVAVFAIDGETGKLTPTGQEVKVANPVCVRFTR